MPEFVFCLTTTDKKSIANKIARLVVNARLSACVNIIENVHSVYHWQGKVVTDREYLMVIKTRKNNIDKIQEVISSVHNYQLPEFVWFPLGGGSKQFLKWLGENTR